MLEKCCVSVLFRNTVMLVVLSFPVFMLTSRAADIEPRVILIFHFAKGAKQPFFSPKLTVVARRGFSQNIFKKSFKEKCSKANYRFPCTFN